MDSQLRYKPGVLQQMATVVATLQIEQIRAGIDSLGNSFPPGVDLIDSGDLIVSIRGIVRGDEMFLEAAAPYAEAVHARYGFLGICPAWMPELEKRLRPIADAGIFIDESDPG